jgi:uncharacterized membrane protein
VDEQIYAEVMTIFAKCFEVIAALVLIIGLLASAVFAIKQWRRTGNVRAGYTLMRQSFGSVLLLGLEILVAGDLIQTVAVSPTLESVSVLGLIVLIRTFLSFSLEIEMEGTVPWRRPFTSGASTFSKAQLKANEVPDKS